jgi:hypothetical protein
VYRESVFAVGEGPVSPGFNQSGIPREAVNFSRIMLPLGFPGKPTASVEF